MLCSHEKRFIYIKTRKTAGTSVEIFFERFCLPEGQFRESETTNQRITEQGIVGHREELFERPDFYNHMPASDIKSKLGREIFETYYKFCTIRNPFDKVVSHFWWHSRSTFDFSSEPFSKIKARFAEFVLQGLGSFNDRKIFMIDGHSVIDEFIRYEHLPTDMAKVCKTLDINFCAKLLGNYKSGFRKRQEHFSEYYNAVTKRLVEQEFSWEINHLKYSLSESVQEDVGSHQH
jgi:hypothetical protein